MVMGTPTGLPMTIQGSAKRLGCLLSYSQAEPGRELTQPIPRLLAEPCTRLALNGLERVSLEAVQ